uniref:Melanocortin 2 receptor accessory protein n=1 Tax=Mus musculus TaxID=10090 RepID=A0A338P7B6_MOUSE
MANGTDASVPLTSYEYYLDYIDLIPVDEKKLKANKL